MSALLRVEDLSKSYGAFQAVKGVSFSVGAGETLAIIGPNGAGKTTLFKVMTGEVSGSSGRIFLRDVGITHLPADERIRMGLGRTFQIVRIFPELTLLENLVVAIEAKNRCKGTLRWLRVRPTDEIRDEAFHRLHRLGLSDQWSMEARFLSLGDRKRLEFALTLALEPMILMLDEPTAGMSVPERVGIIDLIESTKEEMGLTILLSEHDMDLVFRLSNSLMVMNQGEKIFVGTPEEARASETVQQIYLGKEKSHA
jgi:branched-chain amino acid transport system ATP-binding protein